METDASPLSKKESCSLDLESSWEWPESAPALPTRRVQPHGGHILPLFKVPVDQRRANPDAFDPFFFSFGPYHADGPLALEGDHHFKAKAAQALLGEPAETSLQLLINKIQLRISDIGHLYIQMKPHHLRNPQGLASCLALDGLTILAAALRRYDALMSYPIRRLVLIDAILLENQVPMFVIQHALESLALRDSAHQHQPSPTLLTDEHQPRSPLEHHVLMWFCDCVCPFPSFKGSHFPALSTSLTEPLLAYLYDYLTASSLHNDVKNERAKSVSIATDAKQYSNRHPSFCEDPFLPTASHLSRSGIRFCPSDENFSGIVYDDKAVMLSLPRIVVGDTTIRFVHNLLAYEATSRYPYECHVVSYVHFMDCLINTEKDVQVLVEARVIQNALGSHKELASSWNKLLISVAGRSTPQHQDIMSKLARPAKRRWRRWIAGFKEQYWEKQPWLLISVFAAVILLVLSFLQTIYTIKSA